MVDLPKLEYLYLSRTSINGFADDVDPHEQAASGGGDVHPGKDKRTEQNVWRGPLPAPTNPASSVLKWLYITHSDSDRDLADGLSSMDSEWFEVTSLKGLYVWFNYGIADFQMPASFASMTNLTHVALEGGDGWLTGSLPSDLSALSGMKWFRIPGHEQLEIDLANTDFSTMTGLEMLWIGGCSVSGTLPNYFFDGTLPDMYNFINSWPADGAPGAEGAHPEIAAGINSDGGGYKIFQYRNNNLTSLPASLWHNNEGIIQPEFTDNKLTTIGNPDLSNHVNMRYLRLAGNELHEPWPILNWSDTGSRKATMDNNRFVFKHMLYVPGGQSRTILDLYQSYWKGGVDYAPQKPFGQTRTINYAEGNNVTINDFDTIVTHADNEYQWQKDGANISGATSRSLTISNAQSSDAGTYKLIVTNPGAPALTLTSEPIELVIN